MELTIEGIWQIDITVVTDKENKGRIGKFNHCLDAFDPKLKHGHQSIWDRLEMSFMIMLI